MIDPVNLLEMTVYSKIISEVSPLIINDVRIMITIILSYLLYNYFPKKYYEYLFSFAHNLNESFIIIPSHKKTYHINGISMKEIVKIKYSNRFKALQYLLLHNCKTTFPQLHEVMEIVDNCKEYSHTELEEYILMPYQNTKVLICPDRNIYLELTITTENIDTNETSTKKHTQMPKQYACKIFTPYNNISVLHEFLDECIQSYEESKTSDGKHQSIFEYRKTEFDDDYSTVAKYVETRYNSKKHIMKNIIIPDKTAFIQ
jgi:hypothetical protein